MSNYNVNYRHNPIEPPEPEQNPQNDSDKPEARDIMESSPALRWLDNFWYHNKWTVIVVTFFVAVAIICLVQMVNRPRYDTSVCLASTYRMNKEERAEFEKLLTRICPEDFNGNGEKLVNLVEYQIYSEEEFESEADRYEAMTDENGNPDQFQINRKFNSDEYKNFSNFTMTGETSVYILSPYLYGILRDADRLKPLSEVYTNGDLPTGALPDGFGIALKDTDFYKYNPAAQIYPENAILCLHKPTISGRSKNEARYAEDMAFFKAIADFEVQE
ncbi:MAG: hypothetical protein IJD38_05565 [Clostridia bacterium]|nr:hypothetical protein [Clostridia bacterium]